MSAAMDNVTFGTPDFFPDTDYYTHFSIPRISGLSMELDPSSGGTVSWKQTEDRAAITFNYVPPFGGGTLQRFQIELFFDGAIAITWLSTPDGDVLVGVSAGNGKSLDFAPSDLSSYSTCVIDQLVVTPPDRLFAEGCEGGPFAPQSQCQTYTLTNTSAGTIDWIAAGNEAWLETSPASGQLAAGNSVNIDICVGSAAAGLSQDTYSGFVQFTYDSIPIPSGRRVQLAVGGVLPFPSGPDPSDGESDVSPASILNWESIGAMGCPTAYDVLLGTVPMTLETVCEDISGTACSAAPLEEYTTYYWRVMAENCCSTTPGPIWSFTTGDRVEYYTEAFDGAMDLENSRIIFTPNATVDYYDVCIEPATSYPRDPDAGTQLTLDDDDFASVTLSGGQFVSLYTVDYDTVYVGSNGYITFGQGDSTYSPILDNHFSLPRISLAMTDLDPESGGTVSWQQTVESLVVTYNGVLEYGTGNINKFQVELFFDGVITMTHLQMDADWYPIVGLSQGNGVPADFLVEDFSARDNCNGVPGCAECLKSYGNLFEVGQDVCIRVPDPASPWSSYQWSKDDSDLTLRVDRIDCRTLELLSIDFDDAGTYRCTYENGMKAPAEYVFILKVGEEVPTSNPVVIIGLSILCVVLGLYVLRRKVC